jgi:hypothetical protein
LLTPQSQDRTLQSATPPGLPLAAAPYRASGLVPCPRADPRLTVGSENTDSSNPLRRATLEYAIGAKHHRFAPGIAAAAWIKTRACSAAPQESAIGIAGGPGFQQTPLLSSRPEGRGTCSSHCEESRVHTPGLLSPAGLSSAKTSSLCCPSVGGGASIRGPP